ncbi:hypothetical protein H9Q73_007214 [Fusarium xylarioides]|nr:hypothetical protein H9Q73_007214 [Fusarium xylarioides]
MWVSSTANPSEYPVTRKAKLKNFKGPLVMVSVAEEQEDEPGANSFTLSADFRPVFPTTLSPFVLPTISGPSPTTSVFGTRQAFIDELLAISSPWHVAGFTFVLSTNPLLHLRYIQPQTLFTMPSILNLVTRSDMPADSDGSNDNMINLMLGLLGLVFLGLILVAILFLFRRARRQKQQTIQSEEDGLPSYYDSNSKRFTNHRGLTIETTHNGRSSVFVVNQDGRPMLANPNSPPYSPDNVPEIHITFPDEKDEQGRQQSGRVLVVRVGDNSTVGLEPMNEEQLPAYEKEAKGQFYSIDMDQIGGLKEKDRT